MIAATVKPQHKQGPEPPGRDADSSSLGKSAKREQSKQQTNTQQCPQALLIKNLEAFGLDPAVVADTLQRQVQASCVLNESPGAKNRVLVQIQGNQVQHVGKLLLDRYQIPRKYVQGLDKAPKPGKKK
ncbi:Eukaryotic translation initiation factor 2D [Anabarilius grahami]|uniref:Eukaryotic translation initiation factor 2D n=1 Tax=Anabarilius grahami TaxID=495550 RepID=A0A3N0Y745_ANAGA|nr:Eukaryotic translation initiation factor 2D [Anabarilius grahami]